MKVTDKPACSLTNYLTERHPFSHSLTVGQVYNPVCSVVVFFPRASPSDGHPHDPIQRHHAFHDNTTEHTGSCSRTKALSTRQ